MKINLCRVLPRDGNSSDTLERYYSYYFEIANYDWECCNVYLDSLYKIAIDYKKNEPNNDFIETIAFSKKCESANDYDDNLWNLTRRRLIIQYDFEPHSGANPKISRVLVHRRGRFKEIKAPIDSASEGEYDDCCGILNMLE
ncbi:MAG: hypothetical protein IT258_20135 [Saprospiraceae bacterium]|nr:hypothetical protein [Saprospiraceae bacterium]